MSAFRPALRPRRRYRSWPDLDGVRVLRTLDESLALREHATTARKAVVVGAGFIGCEVAASLRTLGVEVLLVEPQRTPLASVLGEQIGELVARLHREEGVDVRCGLGVAEITGSTHVQAVTLTDGTTLDADLVVVGRTTVPNVWALGDVASWRDQRGHQVRVEHWSNVAEQARVLVPALLGADAGPAAPVVPYFWSDHDDLKIQCLGEPAADDVVQVVTDDGHKFLAFYERNGAVVAVVGGGMSGKVMKARTNIAAGAPITSVL